MQNGGHPRGQRRAETVEGSLIASGTLSALVFCFVLFCLFVFDILIPSSSVMTPPRAALPSVTRPRQAAGLAPRSQNFLCRVHGVGFDGAAFCLRNSMCLSDVSSGCPAGGRRQTPRESQLSLHDPCSFRHQSRRGVRAQETRPRNPPRGCAGLWRVCAACFRVTEGGCRLHAFARWRRPRGCGDIGSGTPCVSRGNAVHPCSRQGFAHPPAVRRAPRATGGGSPLGCSLQPSAEVHTL